MAKSPLFGNFFAGNDTPYNNSNTLMSVGLGLLSGKTGNEQVGNAASNFVNERQMGKTFNKTIDLLKQQNPQLAEAVQAGMISPLDAYKTHLESQKPKNNFTTVGKNLYNYETGEWVSPPSSMQEGAEYGLNPVWGQNATGETVLGQLAKDGTFQQTKLPDGFQPTPGITNLDLGTSILSRNSKTGGVVAQTPKDLAGAEREKAGGKALGEVDSAYKSMTSKMPGLEMVVSKLDDLSNKATYTYGGQALDAAGKQLGMDPRESAVARAEYIATVDNQVLPLLRDTFGAQFTQKEGETLRLTLGDPNKSPAEKQAVLKAFIEQKRRDVEALGSQIGIQPNNGGMRTKSGVSWSVE